MPGFESPTTTSIRSPVLPRSMKRMITGARATRDADDDEQDAS